MNRKILLNEKDIPRQWYNLAADLPNPPLPPLGPDGKPINPEMLAPVFPMNIIEQEVSTQRSEERRVGKECTSWPLCFR
jgi:tryptophan synthase beta chain